MLIANPSSRLSPQLCFICQLDSFALQRSQVPCYFAREVRHHHPGSFTVTTVTWK